MNMSANPTAKTGSVFNWDQTQRKTILEASAVNLKTSFDDNTTEDDGVSPAMAANK